MPDTTIIHMYAVGDGDADNALANIDIPEDGTIVGVDWAINVDLDADGEAFVAELSFIATNQVATNDARGVISDAAARMSLTTSGIAVVAINKYVPLQLFVSGGERLYIHAVASTGVASAIYCNVHFQPVGGTNRRSARRR